ncbi:hypothetical protein PIB30_019749 [Stylosanthes scabra]|uniref:Uncharacterized protein n=1 Tax=Stylosanthes scabra TaxID=79078 RepID=A0ABU6W8G9_9FABA|nr:hypothetical protein [Stylosanthes scabra]
MGGPILVANANDSTTLNIGHKRCSSRRKKKTAQRSFGCDLTRASIGRTPPSSRRVAVTEVCVGGLLSDSTTTSKTVEEQRGQVEERSPLGARLHQQMGTKLSNGQWFRQIRDNEDINLRWKGIETLNGDE